MRTPTTSELLEVWERSAAQTPAERALALLALAMPEYQYADLARCSIGGRDDLLLALRQRLFGDELASVTHCPACAEPVETRWGAAQLRAGMPPPAAAPLELVESQHRIAYRLPNTADLLALPPDCAPDESRRQLLTRCVVSADVDGATVAAHALPQSALDALELAMAEADPMADIEMAMICPACNREWNLGFDIVSYLWSELHAWAQRLLLDVHRLARAYGWSEAEILALSPGRRALYVEMSS